MDIFLALLVAVAGYFARKWLKTLEERKMSKFISLMITLVVSLFAINALAFEPPAAPADGYYVVDLAGKLSASQKRQLNQKIEQVNRATKNEFGVLVLNTMDGDNIEDVANATFKKWGIGKHGLDNGVLIVVSVKERKSRIETGKGVEGDVPDLKAKDILQKNLAPHLVKGDFYGGFDETLSALSSLIESRHNQKAEPLPATPIYTTPNTGVSQPSASAGCDAGGAGLGGFGLFLGAIIGVAAILLIRSSQRRAAEQRRLAEEAREQAERVRQELRAQAEEAARNREEQKRRDREHEALLREQRELELAKQRKATMSVPTPSVAVPSVPRPTPKKNTPKKTTQKKVSDHSASTAAAAALSAAAAAEAAASAERYRRQQEEEARARRERDEADRRRREREEEERRNSYSSSSSSSSSFDWGSSWGSSDSGSGFGGGDSGGGGSSGDW